MTTDHVYRPAMSRERAVAELFEHAGTQFDPGLVREFAKMSSHTEAEINQHVCERWNQTLTPSSVDSLWQLKQPLNSNGGMPSAELLFQQKLLDAMHDGVVFIDSSGRILLWNHGAERLTGMSTQSVFEKKWAPSMLDLRDQEGNQINDDRCPVRTVIRTGVQSLRRVTITHANFKKISVDIHVIPVVDERQSCYGATLLIHDASSETHLEERVQNLHERATTDPLTCVHNRAEFERVHQRLVETSFDTGVPCSIIIADIDRFKQINDVYGHQAGDQALVNFAALLQSSTRPGDLVARYGGEEFVLLCAGCDNSTAARRAEQIRRELAQTPQEALNGRCMTASFGVTELQLGDTTETMLRRSDRALYQAKDSGRNRVIQLGSGIVADDECEQRKSTWFSWLTRIRKDPEAVVTRTLVANVPMSVLAEKIRGFIADHHADIVSIQEDYVELNIDTQKITSAHVPDDVRHATFAIEIKFREQEPRNSNDTERRGLLRTMIDVSIKPKRSSERRNTEERGSQVLSSLKSYLIAQDYFAD
jgi:diguanylate cyclase (GGDEF)-like protein/PAS domain S-box-containing protein